jgi:hypothetical protein
VRFLVISEGDTPATREPLIASSDPELLDAVVELVVSRLSGHPLVLGTPVPRRLSPVPGRSPGKEGES